MKTVKEEVERILTKEEFGIILLHGYLKLGIGDFEEINNKKLLKKYNDLLELLEKECEKIGNREIK
jgi:hypothetical protein